MSSSRTAVRNENRIRFSRASTQTEAKYTHLLVRVLEDEYKYDFSGGFFSEIVVARWWPPPLVGVVSPSKLRPGDFFNHNY